MSAGHNEGEVAPTFPAQPERGERHEFRTSNEVFMGGDPQAMRRHWQQMRCSLCGHDRADPIHHPAPKNEEKR